MCSTRDRALHAHAAEGGLQPFQAHAWFVKISDVPGSYQKSEHVTGNSAFCLLLLLPAESQYRYQYGRMAEHLSALRPGLHG